MEEELRESERHERKMGPHFCDDSEKEGDWRSGWDDPPNTAT
jgi:hypothetical protein